MRTVGMGLGVGLTVSLLHKVQARLGKSLEDDEGGATAEAEGGG